MSAICLQQPGRESCSGTDQNCADENVGNVGKASAREHDFVASPKDCQSHDGNTGCGEHRIDTGQNRIHLRLRKGELGNQNRNENRSGDKRVFLQKFDLHVNYSKKFTLGKVPALSINIVFDKHPSLISF